MDLPKTHGELNVSSNTHFHCIFFLLKESPLRSLRQATHTPTTRSRLHARELQRLTTQSALSTYLLIIKRLSASKWISKKEIDFLNNLYHKIKKKNYKFLLMTNLMPFNATIDTFSSTPIYFFETVVVLLRVLHFCSNY